MAGSPFVRLSKCNLNTPPLPHGASPCQGLSSVSAWHEGHLGDTEPLPSSMHVLGRDAVAGDPLLPKEKMEVRVVPEAACLLDVTSHQTQ